MVMIVEIMRAHERGFWMDYALLFVIQPKIYLHTKKDFLIWSTVRCRHFSAIIHLVPAAVGSGNKEKIKCSFYSGGGWHPRVDSSLSAFITIVPKWVLPTAWQSFKLLIKLHPYFLTCLFYLFSPTSNVQHFCFHLTIYSLKTSHLILLRK